MRRHFTTTATTARDTEIRVRFIQSQFNDILGIAYTSIPYLNQEIEQLTNNSEFKFEFMDDISFNSFVYESPLALNTEPKFLIKIPHKTKAQKDKFFNNVKQELIMRRSAIIFWSKPKQFAKPHIYKRHRGR